MDIFELSYNPRDPLYDLPGLPGVRWGLQIFTINNLYQLDPSLVMLSEDGFHLRCDGLAWGGQQQKSAGTVEVQIHREGDAYSWTIEAQHAEPLKVVKLLLWGLPADSLAEGWWQATSTADRPYVPSRQKPMNWSYPWREWLTPWACAGQTEGKPHIVVSLRDPEVRAKRLYTHLPPYSDEQPVVEVIYEEDAARWGNHIRTCPIRLLVTPNQATVDADFEAHLAFIESAYHLQPWETRPDVPAWMRDIKLVLNLHGQHWTGYVFNTFDQMGETLKLITEHVPGDQILGYIPGFEGRYYYAYPHYRPGEAMGGEAGFRRLMATANSLGVKLMPMFGMHGTNVQVYPDYRRSTFVTRTNSAIAFVNFPDWDTDRFGEDDQVFLNPGEPTFRAHLLEQVSAIVRDFGVQGVFLDTSACWFNDPRHNLIVGYQALIGELHTRFPNLLIAGEGWYDAILGLMPVNQSWLRTDRQFMYPQLLTRYGRALGHLAEGAPGPVSTGVHEGGFRYVRDGAATPGHIPSIGIADDTVTRYREELIALCKAAVAGK